MKEQLGIVFGSFARMHPAHASIHAIEAKIAARRSTSIEITRCHLRRQKASHRMCYAWTDNLVAASVRCHIRDPWKAIVEVFIDIRRLLAYPIQGLPGQPVNRAGWTPRGFLLTNLYEH